MSDVFQNMLVHENLVDVTLACEGASIKAHKMILAACSPYFQNLFMANPCKHPIVILKDVKFNDLKAIIDFIYSGEVNIPQDQLNSLLKTAETLKIKGLADFGEKQLPNSTTMRNNNNTNALGVYSSINFSKKRKRPRIQYALSSNNLSAIHNSPHKTYSKLSLNNSTVQANAQSDVTNGENGDSSDEGNNSSKSASIDKSFYSSNVNSPNFKNVSSVQQQSNLFENDNDRDDSEEFEPTKLLEQSMSTPEVSAIHYNNLPFTHSSPLSFTLRTLEWTTLQRITPVKFKVVTRTKVKVSLSLSPRAHCLLLVCLCARLIRWLPAEKVFIEDEYSSNNSNNELTVLPVGLNSFSNQFNQNSNNSNSNVNGNNSNNNNNQSSRTIEGNTPNTLLI